MFSLALKNAILLVLIILIVHILLQNLINKTSAPEQQHFTEPPPPPENDENELYKYLFEKKLPSEPTEVVQPPPKPQPEPIDTGSIGTIGNFSKFCDYAPV